MAELAAVQKSLATAGADAAELRRQLDASKAELAALQKSLAATKAEVAELRTKLEGTVSKAELEIARKALIKMQGLVSSTLEDARRR